MGNEQINVVVTARHRLQRYNIRKFPLNKLSEMVESTAGQITTSSEPAPDFGSLVALFNACRYADLENQTRVLLAKHPSHPFAWQLLGGALQMQGKDALDAFKKVVELSPNDANAHFNLGVAFKNTGAFDLAIASYRFALALKPDYLEALGNLGNVLCIRDLLDDAILCYQQALSIKPHFADTQRNLDIALAQKHRNEITRLIELFNAERFIEVETQVRFLLEQFSNSAAAWMLLGNCLHRLHRLLVRE